MPQLILFKGKTKRINVAREIGIEWWDIGTVLLNDENGTIMPAIAKEFRDNAQDINREVFRRWLQGEGIECTWHALLDALSGPCGALAESVREALTVDPEEEATDGEPGKHMHYVMYVHMTHTIVLPSITYTCVTCWKGVCQWEEHK